MRCIIRSEPSGVFASPDLNMFVGFLESNGKSDITTISKEDVRHFLSERAKTNGTGFI